MSQLIQKAREIYGSLPVKDLQREGFWRDQWSYEFISIYPPIKTHKPIKPQEIFTGEPKEREVDIYVHIPFCTGRCGYCGRYDVIQNPSEQFVEEYLRLLDKERGISLSQRDLGLMKVGYVYIGGGTPTYLTTEQISRLLSGLPKSEEFTVEGSPETITKEKLEVLVDNRVNRFSMGVQTYQDRLLQVAGRRHDSSEARKKSNLISSFGFKEFNIDLMTGLANQNLEDFEDDLNKSLESDPTSVTVYPMYIRPGCRFASLDRAKFPSPEDWLLMQIMAREFFEERRYSQGPVHYFSRVQKKPNGYQTSKWKALETLALGVSSYQFFNNIVFHNFFSREFERYKGAINNNKLPVGYGIRLDIKEQIARTVVLAMKGSGVVNNKQFKSRFGIGLNEIYPDVMKRLIRLGLIDVDSDLMRLSPTGEFFSEEVAREFFTEETKKTIGNRGYVGYSLAELPKA